MITAKPLKRKGLRSPAPLRITISKPQEQLTNASGAPTLHLTNTGEVKGFTDYRTPREINLITKEIIVKEPALESKTQVKLMTKAIFNKLVIRTIAGTGGITSMHCYRFIEEFMRRYNWVWANSMPRPIIYIVLKELVDKGEIDRIEINGRFYYFKFN